MALVQGKWLVADLYRPGRRMSKRPGPAAQAAVLEGSRLQDTPDYYRRGPACTQHRPAARVAVDVTV